MQQLQNQPRLTIVKQNCLAEESIENKNGDPTTVCVVVKHSPFVVQLSVNGSNATGWNDLTRMSFDAKLIYDTTEAKEVDFIKLKPLEFKVKVEESNLLVNIECRIKVLTRQLEDMFFRLRFTALDPITKRELLPSLTTVSQPIKVISKPEQLRNVLPQTNKRKLNDVVSQGLDQIESNQKSQDRLIEQLKDQISFLVQDRIKLQQQLIQSPAVSREKPSSQTDEDLDVSVENAFKDLLVYFNSLPSHVRAKRMRLAVQKTDLAKDFVSEFVDMFSAQGFRKPNLEKTIDQASEENQFFNPLDECECEGCPHKQEVKRIQEFYKLFSV
jgi:hypothetical protein